MIRKDLIRHPSREGCSSLRDGRRHSVYVNARTSKVARVPRHRAINALLAQKICRDLEVPTPR